MSPVEDGQQAFVRPTPKGNALGATRAEVDGRMLAGAFVETADYKALTSTEDFNYVVGRRGTGKTALFLKVSDYVRSHSKAFLYTEKPAEHDVLSLQSILAPISSEYRPIRAITRILWRAHILHVVLARLLDHWKAPRSDVYAFLLGYKVEHQHLFAPHAFESCSRLLRHFRASTSSATELPGTIAHGLQIERLHEAIESCLSITGASALVLFDGLDEGWEPTAACTAILGGLAEAVSDIRERHSDIHATLFLRDNIFRALAHLDPDYSRHIEGHVLRLHWDESSLLHLIANRLRVVLDISDVDSDVKVWNRFAQRGLAEREGFRHCLQNTLFRPRDILVLLNQAFTLAARAGRHHIVDDDIETTSRQISHDRLTDLLREYDRVFPGLDLLVHAYSGRDAFSTVGTAVGLLEDALAANAFDRQAASDFAVLGSGAEILAALYSVGFIGVQDSADQRYHFCHDGSRLELDLADLDKRIAVHPCYWKALDLKNAEDVATTETVLSHVFDENDAADPDGSGVASATLRKGTVVGELRDVRRKLIGQLVAALPNLPLGDEGAAAFELWVHRAVRIVFAGTLTNPELKPNKNAIQRRDIVATIDARSGIWKRILDDYGSRQLVIEVKNYVQLEPEDFRQALSYAAGQYGRCVVVLTRAEKEAVSPRERGWIKEMWHEHNRLIFVVPASLLCRCIAKLRNANRYDYPERTLSRRLDTFLRSYVAMQHERQ